MRRSPTQQDERNRNRAEVYRKRRGDRVAGMEPTPQGEDRNGKPLMVWRPVLKESSTGYMERRAFLRPTMDADTPRDTGSRYSEHRDASGKLCPGTKPFGKGMPSDYEEAREAAA